MARDFNGTTDYLDLGDIADMELVAPWTVALWVMPDVLPTGDKHMVSKYSPGGDNRAWYFQFSLSPYKPSFVIRSAGTNLPYNIATATTAFSSADLGKWTHLGFTVDASNNWTHYRNGTADGAGVFTITVFNGTASACIGNQAGNASYFDGKLAEVAKWDIDLGADEMNAIALGVSPKRIRQDSLKVHLPIWGVQLPEIDLSSNGHTATAGGSPARHNHPPVSPFLSNPARSLPLIEVSGGAPKLLPEDIGLQPMKGLS